MALTTSTFEQMQVPKFLGQDCVLLENKTLKLLVTQSVGPRILSVSFAGGENIMAELPNAILDCPGTGEYHVYGGHRLWHSPEEPSRTYLPDDLTVKVTPVENGYLFIQDVESKTGIQKSMKIRLAGDAPQVVITHSLTNQGLWPVACAPWAITQLKPGGVAILPQSDENTGVLPNRSLALWPYTNMADANVQWGSRYIILNASMETPFKVGFPNPRGWLAYWLNGSLFVKRAKYEAQSPYFDFGSSSECYCNGKFIELETLAPITELTPGMSVSHVETWEFYADVECPRNESDAQVIVEKFGL